MKPLEVAAKKLKTLDEMLPIIQAMYDDHIQYPQLRLAAMQADRLKKLLKLKMACEKIGD